jgi:hypothetical protein
LICRVHVFICFGLFALSPKSAGAGGTCQWGGAWEWSSAPQTPVVSEEESNFGEARAVVGWRVPVLAEAKIDPSVVREEPVLQHGSFGWR